MRRIQFIEIHEQPWLPTVLRDEITDALQFGLNLFKGYAPVAPKLQRALDATNSRSIVDLCSGGGGPWAHLSRKLHGKEGGLQISLTDKFPNASAIHNVATNSENRIRFYPDSVDAKNVPRELKGLRTMFTSFHHFSPNEARAILQNAVDAKEGICIFEITRRSLATIFFMLVWVMILGACTPWIRPFRWSRLLLTYLVPIIPLLLLFDGIVSCLRTYRPDELRAIVKGLNVTGYWWEVGEQAKEKVAITYLIGFPGADPRSLSKLEDCKIPATNRSDNSFVAQSLDRVEPRGADGWHHPTNQSNGA
jgi:hypothetical protein